MKTNIDIGKIMCIFIIISLFKPVGLAQYEILDIILKVCKVISIIIILIAVIRDEKNETIKIGDVKYLFPLLFFWTIYIFNSYIHKADYLEIINNALTSITIILFIRFAFKNKDKKEIFLNSVSNVFVVYIIIHLLSFVIINIFHTPLFGSKSTLYFLGMDNYSAFATIPMITIILFNNVRKNQKFTILSYVLVMLLFLSYLYAKSYAATFAYVLFIVGIVLIAFNKDIFKIINFKSIIALTIILLILIMVFNIQDFFSFILINVIKKGVTLNSRTIIWRDAINIIKSNFVIGYGNLSSDNVANYYLYGTTHTHNFLLELLFTTGIVGTISFLFFYNKAFTDMYNIKNGKNNIFLLGVVVFIILSFMDYYVLSQYQYCLIGIMYGVINMKRSNQSGENREFKT